MEISDKPIENSVVVIGLTMINGCLWAESIETGLIGSVKGRFSLYVGSPYAEALLKYIESKK